MHLSEALQAGEGTCCFVGAGGKKTTMYRLADRADRAVVTSTVRIPIFDDHVASVSVTEEPGATVDSATEWPLGIVPERDGEDRYGGYDPAAIDDLRDADADVILVKADGARMRRFKAPDEHEPRIPSRADTVVPVVSAQVVGEPLDDRLVHRVDRVCEIGGVSNGDVITPALIGRVLASPAGGQKDVPSRATVVPLINMVDDEDDLAAGRAIAAQIHGRANVPRVVLASMRDPDPIVDVIDTPSRF